jgi:hypothetical protein
MILSLKTHETNKVFGIRPGGLLNFILIIKGNDRPK